MKRVIIESPYAGDCELNLRYVRMCMHDSIVNHGEAPYASHALYTQPGVLQDAKQEQRQLGIESGFAWRDVADATIVYTDLGISTGMTYGIKHAEKLGKPIEYRQIFCDEFVKSGFTTLADFLWSVHGNWFNTITWGV